MKKMTTWQCLPFADLNTQQLYDLLALRQEIFVVEQVCPYLDADGKDLKSWHVLGYQDNDLVAYTRILPRGVSYKDAVSIGRVATSQKVRRKGLGKELTKITLDWTEKLFPSQRIRISAQTYLIKFYQAFDFQVLGEEYLEDDIPHIQMVIEGE